MINSGIWRQLTASTAQLPHALLLAGPEGLGKRELAEKLASRLLCELPRQPGEAACGACASCLMMINGTHPDFRLVQPESAEEESETPTDGEKKKASKQIRIQQIRELEEFFHVGGHRGGARVCIIDPAESMNAITANSLLKILEEPSSSFYFLMVSHRWRKLLPTLLSRSRRVMFAGLSEDESRQWLAAQKLSQEAQWLPFFGYAPLAVAAAAESGRLKALDSIVTDLMQPQDALAQAGKWESLVKVDATLSMEDIVTTLQKWHCDLGLSYIKAPPRYFPQQRAALTSLAGRVNLHKLMTAQTQLTQMRSLANHPLNPRLFLEDLCVRAFQPLN